MGVRFRLFDMFFCVTAVACGLAIERSLGTFPLMLICGLIVIGCTIWLLRVKSILRGAAYGFSASFAVYLFAGLQLSDWDAITFTAGCFAYLAIGLAIGMVTVADRVIREAE